MQSSQLSNDFLYVPGKFCQTRGFLQTLCYDLLLGRAQLYFDLIYALGSTLEKCIGFLNCTKIKICCPGGQGSIQQSAYSDHKRFRYFMYMTITTPDELISVLHRAIEGRRHD